ncbi:Nucleoporin GLE2 [Hyphodiscus hymeniophilus]|uniref:Nucleoporin GLE2 n=1 Tax=Hyphodiscus hymeniophilus TaxID=353542 RepID=A0A9P6VP19_9HELO|nr:Nucleoporin GLE2 [Hyphodiscus hymeniophilus]
MSSRFGSSSSAPNGAGAIGDLSHDVILASPPEDSISDLAWSSRNNFLAVASWDSKVRVYDVTQNLSGVGKAVISFDGPVFGCAWSKNGRQVAGASSDKSAKLLDLGANGAPAQQVAAHDAPIRSLRFFELPSSGSPMLATGSWDKTIKYWDLRQSAPAAVLHCPDRVYSMDIKKDILVVATAELHINIVKLNEPTRFLSAGKSPLAHQTRVVSCFNDASGYAVGSTEGRCAFQYIETKSARGGGNFSFKCHRGARDINGKMDIFTINAISVHPIYGLTTAGSDGTFNFWDKDKRQRLKGYPSVGGPISATAFNHSGKIFAYAVSYDWSKGYAFNTPGHVNKVMLHRTIDEECKPK